MAYMAGYSGFISHELFFNGRGVAHVRTRMLTSAWRQFRGTGSVPAHRPACAWFKNHINNY